MIVILSSCIPFPHYAVVSPAVTGKVHRNGTPIENAVVYMEYPKSESCTFQSEILTHTDSDGKFHLEIKKEFQFFVAMDPWQSWQVCIEDGDRHYQGWYQHALGGPPPEMKLDCNLESGAHVKQIGKSMGKIMGICNSNMKYN